MFQRLLQDERGATAIEYGLVAILIAVAAVTSIVSLGNVVEEKMDAVETQYTNASASSG